jgi:hypothetical protein
LAIGSSIASGMISLTAIVFSLAFVMVQFSATAYSPRLVLWIARDRVIWHAIGVFTATFIYALAAMAWVDRNPSVSMPLVSATVVVALLLSSVAMFVALIERISLLQISRMSELHRRPGPRRHPANVSTRWTPRRRRGRARAAEGCRRADAAAHRTTVRDPGVNVPALLMIATDAHVRWKWSTPVGDSLVEEHR